ncbi:MAG: hypothetical protein QOJ22_1358 [Thermoleophilaceae bacterium]|jgi:hypothetical protein|nr:hypothetical protein [Thermoleophilaceae bacterium]
MTMPTDAPATSRTTNGSGGDASPEPHEYAALNAVFAALLAGVVVAARERTSERDPLTSRDLAVTGAATFALSKVIARERIGMWVREPFVDEENGRTPRSGKFRRAVGELVTCTRCVGAWSALGLVGLRLTSPPTGRVVNDVLAVSAMNDWLQAAFKLLCTKTDEASAR